MDRPVIEDMEYAEAVTELERCESAMADPRTRPDEIEGWRICAARCKDQLARLSKPVYQLVEKGKSVEEGEWFHGTMAHWADAFFSNPTIESMRDFAEKNDSVLNVVEQEG